jgi:hypothetical protein
MPFTSPTGSGGHTPGPNDLLSLLDRRLNQDSKRQTSFRPLVKNRRADLFGVALWLLAGMTTGAR